MTVLGKVRDHCDLAHILSTQILQPMDFTCVETQIGPTGISEDFQADCEIVELDAAVRLRIPMDSLAIIT